MAERLGIGLQNQVQQFDSAWHLFKRMTDDGHPLFLCGSPRSSGRCLASPSVLSQKKIRAAEHTGVQ